MTEERYNKLLKRLNRKRRKSSIWEDNSLTRNEKATYWWFCRHQEDIVKPNELKVIAIKNKKILNIFDSWIEAQGFFNERNDIKEVLFVQGCETYSHIFWHQESLNERIEEEKKGIVFYYRPPMYS